MNTTGLPDGIVSTKESIPADISNFSNFDVDTVRSFWKVFKASHHVLKPAPRLENLFWRIWGSPRLLQTLSGSRVACIFMMINQGEEAFERENPNLRIPEFQQIRRRILPQHLLEIPPTPPPSPVEGSDSHPPTTDITTSLHRAFPSPSHGRAKRYSYGGSGGARSPPGPPRVPPPSPATPAASPLLAPVEPSKSSAERMPPPPLPRPSTEVKQKLESETSLPTMGNTAAVGHPRGPSTRPPLVDRSSSSAVSVIEDTSAVTAAEHSIKNESMVSLAHSATSSIASKSSSAAHKGPKRAKGAPVAKVVGIRTAGRKGARFVASGTKKAVGHGIKPQPVKKGSSGSSATQIGTETVNDEKTDEVNDEETVVEQVTVEEASQQTTKDSKRENTGNGEEQSGWLSEAKSDGLLDLKEQAIESKVESNNAPPETKVPPALGPRGSGKKKALTKGKPIATKDRTAAVVHRVRIEDPKAVPELPTRAKAPEPKHTYPPLRAGIPPPQAQPMSRTQSQPMSRTQSQDNARAAINENMEIATQYSDPVASRNPKVSFAQDVHGEAESRPASRPNTPATAFTQTYSGTTTPRKKRDRLVFLTNETEARTVKAQATTSIASPTSGFAVARTMKGSKLLVVGGEGSLKVSTGIGMDAAGAGVTGAVSDSTYVEGSRILGGDIAESPTDVSASGVLSDLKSSNGPRSVHEGNINLIDEPPMGRMEGEFAYEPIPVGISDGGANTSGLSKAIAAAGGNTIVGGATGDEAKDDKGSAGKRNPFSLLFGRGNESKGRGNRKWSRS